MVDIKAKKWTENSEWHPKWHSKWHPKGKEWYSRSKGWHQECEYDTKNDTKNGTLTDDLQEFNNDAMNTHDTNNDTNNWWMKLSVIEANFWNDSMVFNKQQFWKRKNKMVYHSYESPTSLFFWKAKKYLLALLRNSY